MASTSGPAYATGVGLLKWGLEQGDEGDGQHGPGSSLSGPVSAVVSWLRSFLP